MFTLKDITADKLGSMTADELESVNALAIERCNELHRDENGEFRDMDPAEQHEFDRLIELADKAGHHHKIRSMLERGTTVKTGDGNEVRFKGGRNTGLIRRGAQKVSAESIGRMDMGEARDDALRLVEARSELSEDQQSHLDKLFRTNTSAMNGGYLAKRTLLTESDAYRSAWQQLMTEDRPILNSEEIDALRALKDLERQYEGRTAMAEGTGSTGGFGVPVFIDPTINLTAQGSQNPVLELCRKAQVNTNQWKGVSSAGSYSAGASADGSHAPVVNNSRRTSSLSRPHLVAVSR